jgi:hypothetical protein
MNTKLLAIPLALAVLSPVPALAGATGWFSGDGAWSPDGLPQLTRWSALEAELSGAGENAAATLGFTSDLTGCRGQLTVRSAGGLSLEVATTGAACVAAAREWVRVSGERRAFTVEASYDSETRVADSFIVKVTATAGTAEDPTRLGQLAHRRRHGLARRPGQPRRLDRRRRRRWQRRRPGRHGLDHLHGARRRAGPA